MVAPSASAEPIFWVALIVGLLALPLALWEGGGASPDEGVRFAALVLMGLAAFGFGSSVLVAAHHRTALPPVVLLAAVVGSLVGALGAIVMAAHVVTGLRIFALVVMLVDAAALGTAPRVWRIHRRLGEVEPAAPGPDDAGSTR